MAVAEVDFFIFNGKKQLAKSQNLQALFLSLGVGLLADGLTISDVSGKFDFNGKNLSNVAGLALVSGTVTGLPTTAVGSTDATSKSYVDTQDGLRVLKAGDTMSGNLDFGTSFKVTGLATPTSANDAVNKSYADAILVAARIQENVAVATTANISLSSAPATIDGYTLVAGDRVLVKNQTTASQNGIYDFSASGAALTRSASFNNTPTSDVYNGALVSRVENGTQVGNAYVLSSIGTGTGGVHTLGTDAVSWSQFATPASFSAGSGIYFTGSTISANPDGLTLDTAGATANGTATLEVKGLGIGTAQLAAQAVTAAKLGAVTGAGLSGGAGSVIAVNFDNTTLDASGTGSSLEVKALGIGTAQLAANAVTTAKIAAQAVTSAQLGAVTGSGLTGGAGSVISVAVGTETGVQLSGGNVVADYDRTLTNGSATAASVGQLVYLDSTGKIQGLALASVTNLDQYEVYIADAAIAGSNGTGRAVVRVGAIVGGFSSLTPGKEVYVSRATAGAVTQDPTSSTGGFLSGEYVYLIGRAISATEVRFQPKFEWQYA